MSLTSFVSMKDVKAKLKPLRPALPRKLTASLRVQPRSNRYMLVGTAFDYFLRFELQRRAPHAATERWVAEYTPDMIWRKTDNGTIEMDLFKDALTGAGPLDYMPPQEVAERCRRIVADAKAVVATFIRSKTPSGEMQTELVGHAIRLAKLDSVYRALRLDPHFQEVDPEDVQDLVELLSIVPFDALLHETSVLLNPTFKHASQLVGGADADLIAGNLLVDFKTTKKGEMDAEDLDQLLGYLLLARKHREFDPDFPAIDRLGLYYCRRGHLWTVEASIWTGHPAFRETQEWFFNRAKEVFPRASVTAKTATGQ